MNIRKRMNITQETILPKFLIALITVFLTLNHNLYAADQKSGLPPMPAKPSQEEAAKALKEIKPWHRSQEEKGFDVYPGVTIFPKINGSMTNGEFTGLIEQTASNYVGPAHVHYIASETIIMLEGQMEMRISGEDILLKPGDWVYIPPGNPHSLKPVNRNETKLILLHVPGDPNEGMGGPPPLPPEVLTDPDVGLQFYHDNVPDIYADYEMGLPGEK